MSKNIESLWPSLAEIKLPKDIAPVIILQEQAAAIGEETHNIIEGQVILEKSYFNTAEQNKGLESIWSQKEASPLIIRNDARLLETTDFIYYSLFVRSPLLSGYKYRVVSIIHRITDLYPTRVYSEIENIIVCDELAESPEALKNSFRKVLHSEPVRNVLSSILAQSGYRQAA